MRRLITMAAVVGLAALGVAATSVTAWGSQSAGLGPRVQVINLHAAYEAHLGHTKPGKIAGITYPRNKRFRVLPTRNSCAEPNCPLVYHGGSVQHSPHVYLLFWGPTWATDSGEQASAAYLESFYAGLGVQPNDDWSTSNDQYTDSTGSPSFSGSVYEGAFSDTSTPPHGATQSQLAAEADAFASDQGITDLADAQIVVATQSGTIPSGFGTQYCAWHSSSNEPYTNLPYMPDAGSNCGQDFVNPAPQGNEDGFSIVGGHEYAETITDPYPSSGWVDYNDSYGGEIGDKCTWGGQLWGSTHVPAGNVTLSTGTFAMQSLWSNAAYTATGWGCVMASPQLSVSKSGTGASAGTVTSSPAGINCGTTCSDGFAPGTQVTLTATPAAGGVFTGWTGPCTGMASNVCNVTVSSAQSVKASFTASAKLHQETAATYKGTWTNGTCSCYSGGADKYTTAAKASATFTFTGKLIDLVSERGSTSGSFKVYIDGTLKATVSDQSTTTQDAVIVWKKSFSSSGKHTLKIVNVATSGHPRLDVDAFVVGS